MLKSYIDVHRFLYDFFFKPNKSQTNPIPPETSHYAKKSLKFNTEITISRTHVTPFRHSLPILNMQLFCFIGIMIIFVIFVFNFYRINLVCPGVGGNFELYSENTLYGSLQF